MNPLDTTLKVVRCSLPGHEPAIDAARTDLAKYLRTRDPGELHFTDGATPTWFVLRRLPAAFVAGVLDAVSPPAYQQLTALRASLHTIEVGPGETLRVVPPGEAGAFVATKADFGVTMAPESWVQEIADRWGAGVVAEMGHLALQLARLPKGSAGPFGWWGGTALSPSLSS